jgi:hypothetical protein
MRRVHLENVMLFICSRNSQHFKKLYYPVHKSPPLGHILSQMSQFTSFNPISLRLILILSSLLCLDTSSGLYPLVYFIKYLYVISTQRALHALLIVSFLI